MPILKTDSNTQWNLDQSNKTWTLAKDATISVNNANGIYEAGQSGNEIKVLGDIVVKGLGAGVRFAGTDSSVLIGPDSRINANQTDYGIWSEGAGSSIVNRGIILAVNGDGIKGNIWNDVQNYGTIKAEFGMTFGGNGSQIYNYGLIDAQEKAIFSQASGTHIENAGSGIIRSDDVAIDLDGAGTADLINKGTIQGENAAIISDNGLIEIKNIGKIVGDVFLGGADDVFDSRRGQLNGKVDGGDGNDDYYTGQISMKIVEGNGMNSGFDEVFSTVDFKLAANVEELNLIGNKDIDATGNGDKNYLHGNNGDNKLMGLGGDDVMSGKRGNDIYVGGEGFDVFLFDLTGDGVDRIKDFEDGIDTVGIDSINTQQEFDALDIRQVKGNVVIDLGSGDRIIIEDMLKSDFTYDDIAIP